MKIVFEERDIIDVLNAHVKANNILGLADKNFNVELEINGDEVLANLDTDVEALVGGATPDPKPKKRRRRSTTKAEPEPEQEPEKEEAPAAEEKESTPLSKKLVADETPSEESTSDESEDDDDKPPFKTEEEKEAEVKADSKPRKSLFA